MKNTFSDLKPAVVLGFLPALPFILLELVNRRVAILWHILPACRPESFSCSSSLSCGGESSLIRLTAPPAFSAAIDPVL
ncbi:MAG: hypothetical protein QY332_04150 [Anaerolineales bacterium]|nr:MAG: hypothetical protein QY332_04150 [Anaerolineales bacterium]